MTAKPELQIESLHRNATNDHNNDVLIELRTKDMGGGSGDDVLLSVASGSVHGVSTTSPPAGGEDESSVTKHKKQTHTSKMRVASASPVAVDSLGASRRSVASRAPSETNGIYGPSTFGALDRFKDSDDTPHEFSNPKPLSTGRQSSFHNGGKKDERTPVSPMPNPAIPGPGSYNVRPAVEKGSASNFRRVPSLTFNSRHETNWVMLKNGMQVAVLASPTVPVPTEVPEGSVRSLSASGKRSSPSPRRAPSPSKSAFCSTASRFPSSATCTPGPGAYVAVDGLPSTREKTPTKAKRDGSEGAQTDASGPRASSVPHKRASESPKRSRSPAPLQEAGPGPGAYYSPTSSSSILRCGSAKSTFSKAVRESNLPVTKEDGTSHSSRPQLTSWVHSSSNAFLRRSQERWSQKNSQTTSSQAASPRRASSSRASQPASPLAIEKNTCDDGDS